MFEITEIENKERLIKEFEEHILKHLIELNSDFNEAYKENKKALTPIIELYDIGEGCFEMKEGQIKQKRIIK